MITAVRRASRMRDELLNETLFTSLVHARDKIANWVDDYNTGRPHSSLGYATPAAFAAELRTHAHARQRYRGSNRDWMKVGGHIKPGRSESLNVNRARNYRPAMQVIGTSAF